MLAAAAVRRSHQTQARPSSTTSTPMCPAPTQGKCSLVDYPLIWTQVHPHGHCIVCVCVCVCVCASHCVLCKPLYHLPAQMTSSGTSFSLGTSWLTGPTKPELEHSFLPKVLTPPSSSNSLPAGVSVTTPHCYPCRLRIPAV